MKCAFFCEKTSFSLIGVESLISILRNDGHEVRVVFDRALQGGWTKSGSEKAYDDEVVEDILSTNAEIVFAHINTMNFRRISTVFTLLKQRMPEVTTCVGGPHATYAHEFAVARSCFDYVCRGEGEILILELIDMLQGKISRLPEGVYHRVDGNVVGQGYGKLVSNLDSLPFPDKSDFYRAIPHLRGIYTTITGRGCYNRCTFCNSHTIREYYRGERFNFLRRRSVDNVIAELAIAKEIIKPKFVWFTDDTFIHNKKYMVEFADKYKKHIGVPFGCSTIPNFFDKEILESLLDAGLSNVQIGIQSLDPEIRLKIFGRRETNEEFARFVHLLRRSPSRRNAYVNTDHIINPWDTREGLIRQIREYARIRPSYINVFFLQYFPDTEVFKHAVRDGYVSQDLETQIGEGTLESYFSGGSVTDIVPQFKDLIILLGLTPFLPQRLVDWLLDSGVVRFFKYLPVSIKLPVRALSALLHTFDVSGRTQVKVLLHDLIGYTGKFDESRVKRLAEAAQMPGFIRPDMAARLASGLRDEPRLGNPATLEAMG